MTKYIFTSPLEQVEIVHFSVNESILRKIGFLSVRATVASGALPASSEREG